MEHKRLKRKAERRKEEEARKKKQHYQQVQFDDIATMLMELSTADSREESSVIPLHKSSSELTETQQVRKTENVSNIAAAVLRYDVGLRAAATTATAARIDAGIITKTDVRLAIDRN